MVFSVVTSFEALRKPLEALSTNEARLNDNYRRHRPAASRGPAPISQHDGWMPSPEDIALVNKLTSNGRSLAIRDGRD